MSKMATKKAVAQLQKVYDFLGENGGQIHTDSPETWWALNLECCEEDMQIGVFSSVGGDIIFDPVFALRASIEEGKIQEVEICSCEETTLLGTTYVDGEDMLHGFGMKEKDPYGLRKRFSSFMENMTKNGPYLTNPKSVKRY